MMPLHPPEKLTAQAYDEDLELVVLADQLGYKEAWIGEHISLPWENIAASELFIAKALPLTERIIFGTGVVLLAQHHPVNVASRIACLDHLAHGRLYFGIGSGGAASDAELLNIVPAERGSMTREAIDIILKVWTEEPPFEYKGKYWQVKLEHSYPDKGLGVLLKPYQKPYPPIAVAGLSPESSTLRLAGERGWIPMSSNFLPEWILQSHWKAVEEGAAAVGKTVDRKTWRIAREVYVADTTEEAREYALNGAMARAFEEYFLRSLRHSNRLGLFKRDKTMPDDQVTVEYLTDQIWIVGDPEECIRKIRTLYEAVGGFGTLLMICHDWDTKEKWIRSMELFANKVMPALAEL